MRNTLRSLALLAVAAGCARAQQPATVPKPADTEQWTPVPRVVTPGVTDREPPSDAIRLFELWQPDWPTDEGEDLLLHQRVFTKARHRR